MSQFLRAKCLTQEELDKHPRPKLPRTPSKIGIAYDTSVVCKSKAVKTADKCNNTSEGH